MDGNNLTIHSEGPMVDDYKKVLFLFLSGVPIEYRPTLYGEYTQITQARMKSLLLNGASPSHFREAQVYVKYTELFIGKTYYSSDILSSDLFSKFIGSPNDGIKYLCDLKLVYTSKEGAIDKAKKLIIYSKSQDK